MDLLLEKIDCNDSEEVMDYLMEKYGQDILFLAFSYVKNNEVAQDLTQEIFIKCFRALHTYKGASSVKTWIWRIAINHCKDYLKSWHYRNVMVSNNHWENSRTSNESVETVVIHKEEDEMLSRAVLQLPVNYREVLYLYYFENHSLKELEVILKVNINTIKTRLRKAKQLLKKVLEEIDDGR
ncbi:RNA polymerase sigma-H factor [Sutcliffiella rhizosphaerae]|uniref:RNA polymerase sigma-H factor n=1 Tax=Sutcliffiella rhizosphaerae TaxID=2880967 RepID=A0ABN8A856_9BACI|nr:RNA polymerase sigma-H factor [Sutcliffiella rhizosphaerae]